MRNTPKKQFFRTVCMYDSKITKFAKGMWLKQYSSNTVKLFKDYSYNIHPDFTCLQQPSLLSYWVNYT
jgi:hypothetical protein